MVFRQCPRSIWLPLLAVVATTLFDAPGSFADQPQTGPQTEQRFPPLVVPAGFRATLFACDPLVEYPSVIAIGPHPGSVYVAHDYMTGLGTEIVRRDEVRLVEDTDDDGYADKSTVVAGQFNSIQGLAYAAGTVFVMHAPLLTALRDLDGDGVADERQDLLAGLGLAPEDNATRLHCANGVTVGHDGWLYLAMGDNGTNVQRPEGDRLVLNGGGILRCRSDGSNLHVFATGLRNIYDVALDDELNVFVRDNENDGGDYMIRVCHSFHGADHGYPYLYDERPDEALPPIADLGRGSSAGGVCYLESSFPPEMRGGLFFCEWGRAVVRYDRRRSQSGFATVPEIDFAAGATNDPYGFKPTDVIVDRDGSLLVSDWGDGQRPKRGRGRIYRLEYGDGSGSDKTVASDAVSDSIARWVSQLDSPSYFVRTNAQLTLEQAGRIGLDAVRAAIQDEQLSAVGRMHGVWLLARLAHHQALEELLVLASDDADARVRMQAIRAVADLTDPELTDQQQDHARGNATVAARLAALISDQDPRVKLEVVVALGRLRWTEAPIWLRDHGNKLDPVLEHAAMQMLRRSNNWPAVLKLLDEPQQRPIRSVALRAVADRADATIVEGLLERLERATDPVRRQEYADALTRVHRKPAAWEYWGYRPPPRPANTVAWQYTERIEQALDRALGDASRDVRAEVLKRMRREQISIRPETLGNWLREERQPDRVNAILESLADDSPEKARELLMSVVIESSYDTNNRKRAVSALVAGLDAASEPRLLQLAAQVEDGPVLVDLFEAATLRNLADGPLLLGKLKSNNAEVRAAALDSLASFRIIEAAGFVPTLLHDSDPNVRRAAAVAAGSLTVDSSAPSLAILASDDDPAVRSASLVALRQLRQPTAIGAAVSALEHPATQRAALDYLADFGGPAHVDAVTDVASNSRSAEILNSAVRALAVWHKRQPVDAPERQSIAAALAQIQGDSGVVMHWQLFGPLQPNDAAALMEEGHRSGPHAHSQQARWLIGVGSDARVALPAAATATSKSVFIAMAEVWASEPARIQGLAACNSTLEILLNGKSVFHRSKPGPYQPDGDRFEAELSKGINHVLVQVAATEVAVQFHLRFRKLSSSTEHEQLVRYLLQNTGNIDRGFEVFSNTEKSQCLKCHRLEAQGGTIGPDLTGVGSRMSRIHLIESILEPSRTMAPSYETITVILADGRVITGTRVMEDERTLILGDEQGKTHELAQAEIDERRTQPRSTMPEGLEKRLSEREFLDLIAYLLAQQPSR